MKLTTFILSLFISNIYAGFDRGNGGDVIVCYSFSQSVILYDYHEATEIRGWTIQLGSRQLSISEKINIALDRLKKYDPARRMRLKRYADDFFKEAEFKRGIQLNDIPDTGDGWIPEFCELKQIAIQRSELLPGEKKYTIDHNLWDQLDNTNKAMLILHEVIYRDFLEETSNSSVTSRFARYFHETLISDNFSNISADLQSYHNFLKQLHYERAESHQNSNGKRYPVSLTWSKLSYHDENTLKEATLYKKSSVSLPGVKFILSNSDVAQLKFNSEGFLSNISLSPNPEPPYNLYLGKHSFLTKKANYHLFIDLHLLNDGTLTSAQIQRYSEFTFNNNSITCSPSLNWSAGTLKFIDNIFESSQDLECTKNKRESFL